MINFEALAADVWRTLYRYRQNFLENKITKSNFTWDVISIPYPLYPSSRILSIPLFYVYARVIIWAVHLRSFSAFRLVAMGVTGSSRLYSILFGYTFFFLKLRLIKRLGRQETVVVIIIKKSGGRYPPCGTEQPFTVRIPPMYVRSLPPPFLFPFLRHFLLHHNISWSAA